MTANAAPTALRNRHHFSNPCRLGWMEMMQSGGRKMEDDRSSFAEQLQQRVEAARAHPPRSLQRQKLLNQIVQDISSSGRLGHPQQALWPPDLYEDLYNEALQKTLIEICQKIDQYNPQHPVMAWVNFRLNYQFIAVVQDYQRQGITQLPKGEKAISVRLPSLENLPIATPHSIEDDSQLRQFLQADPEGLLQKYRLRDRPEVTFQQLAIAKFIEGKSWPQIAAELEISTQTLCSFFNRHLKNLIPYFKKYLKA